MPRNPAPELPRPIRGGSHTLSARGLVGIQFAATPEERESFRRAAVLAGCRSASEWLRKVAVEAAGKIG